MPPLKNDRLLRALRRQPVDATPVWLMRQAGRYLPEYRAARAQVKDFMALCQTPELACQVTLQPLQRFVLDAAIIFSDILTIPHAMGLGLYFSAGEGPKFQTPLRSKEAIARLPLPDPETELRYVMDAIRLVQHELAGKIPLIGFAGSPWTLATYMVEGGSSKDFSIIKSMRYREPSTLHQLLSLLARAVTDYLNAQIRAGVNALMLFDSWGGVLTTADYSAFSLNYMQQIINGLQPNEAGEKVPLILFTKNSSQWLELMAASGADALSVDWTIDIGVARQRVGDKVALQGNLDPAALFADEKTLRNVVQAVVQSYGTGPGHIFNLGHGIMQNTPPENVAILVDAVHKKDR